VKINSSKWRAIRKIKGKNRKRYRSLIDFLLTRYFSGFLIFLAFVANKRTINKVKAGWSLRFSHLKETTTSQSRQTNSHKLVTSAL